jgi:hypothetical protein
LPFGNSVRTRQTVAAVYDRRPPAKAIALPLARILWHLIKHHEHCNPHVWALAEEKLRTFSDAGIQGQQHGLRMPPRSISMPTSMRRFLVSSFLADVTQQIHSFRASGVISVQRLFAAASDSMAFRKSAGSLCTVPPRESFE